MSWISREDGKQTYSHKLRNKVESMEEVTTNSTSTLRLLRINLQAFEASPLHQVKWKVINWGTNLLFTVFLPLFIRCVIPDPFICHVMPKSIYGRIHLHPKIDFINRAISTAIITGAVMANPSKSKLNSRISTVQGECNTNKHSRH